MSQPHIDAPSAGQPASSGTRSGDSAAVREIDSTDLLGNAKELRIRHAGERYTLRHTSKGKLILTK